MTYVLAKTGAQLDDVNLRVDDSNISSNSAALTDANDQAEASFNWIADSALNHPATGSMCLISGNTNNSTSFSQMAVRITSGVTVSFVRTNSGGTWGAWVEFITTGNADSLPLSTKFAPSSDNTINLGGVSNRWGTVYAGTGTINTSDAREKTSVSAFTVDEINASKQLAKEIGTYKFLSAIELKGDDARTHAGLTVQKAIEVMEANNLVAFDYAFICYDEWLEEKDEAGVVTKEAGNRYGFRYSELNQFILAGIAARLDALEV